MVKKNTCIFISGKGSNLKNLIKRSRDYNFPIKIKLVVSDNKEALGLNYANKNSFTVLANSNTKIEFIANHNQTKYLEEAKRKNIDLTEFY